MGGVGVGIGHHGHLDRLPEVFEATVDFPLTDDERNPARQPDDAQGGVDVFGIEAGRSSQPFL